MPVDTAPSLGANAGLPPRRMELSRGAAPPVALCLGVLVGVPDVPGSFFTFEGSIAPVFSGGPKITLHHQLMTKDHIIKSDKQNSLIIFFPNRPCYW